MSYGKLLVAPDGMRDKLIFAETSFGDMMYFMMRRYPTGKSIPCSLDVLTDTTLILAHACAFIIFQTVIH